MAKEAGWACIYCPLRFTSARKLKKHIEKAHPEKT